MMTSSYDYRKSFEALCAQESDWRSIVRTISILLSAVLVLSISNAQGKPAIVNVAVVQPGDFDTMLSQSKSRPRPSQKICIQLSGFYMAIVNYRAERLTPQKALMFSAGYYPEHPVCESNEPGYCESRKNSDELRLSIKSKKKIINLIYFDPRFRFVDGDAFQMQIMIICLGTYKPMEPLK